MNWTTQFANTGGPIQASRAATAAAGGFYTARRSRGSVGALLQAAYHAQGAVGWGAEVDEDAAVEAELAWQRERFLAWLLGEFEVCPDEEESGGRVPG